MVMNTLKKLKINIENEKIINICADIEDQITDKKEEKNFI